MASNLKQEWMNLPDICFVTLTFGELKVGQKFIGLPVPGDNSGHGGFKKGSYLFIKTHLSVTETECGLPYADHIPHGRAEKVVNNTTSDFPNSMPVLLIL